MNVSRSKVVDAAPEVVWSVVSSVEQLAAWCAGAEGAAHVGGSKNGVGRRQRVTRSLYGRTIETEQEVAGWEPARLLTLRHVKETVEGRDVTGVRDFHTIVTLTPEGPRTRVRVAYQWRAPLGLAWLQGALLAGRVMGKELEASLRNIERLAMGAR